MGDFWNYNEHEPTSRGWRYSLTNGRSTLLEAQISRDGRVRVVDTQTARKLKAPVGGHTFGLMPAALAEAAYRTIQLIEGLSDVAEYYNLWDVAVAYTDVADTPVYTEGFVPGGAVMPGPDRDYVRLESFAWQDLKRPGRCTTKLITDFLTASQVDKEEVTRWTTNSDVDV